MDYIEYKNQHDVMIKSTAEFINLNAVYLEVMMNSYDDVQKDAQRLIADAKALINDATNLSGDEARKLHSQGMTLLNKSIEKLSDYEKKALNEAKEMAQKTDAFVHEKPWFAVGVSAIIGILVGIVIERRR